MGKMIPEPIGMMTVRPNGENIQIVLHKDDDNQVIFPADQELVRRMIGLIDPPSSVVTGMYSSGLMLWFCWVVRDTPNPRDLRLAIAFRDVWNDLVIMDGVQWATLRDEHLTPFVERE